MLSLLSVWIILENCPLPRGQFSFIVSRIITHSLCIVNLHIFNPCISFLIVHYAELFFLIYPIYFPIFLYLSNNLEINFEVVHF